MAPVILTLFIAVPLIEIAVFIEVGGIIGLWPTIGLVILTAVAGTALLRAQGLATLRRAQASLDRGEAPLREVFDGACLLVAGALLLTPGFVTDALGLSLFLPPIRSALLAWLASAAQSGRVRFRVYGSGRPPGGSGPHGGGFGPRGPHDLEGEYRDVTPPDEPGTPPGTPKDADDDPDERKRVGGP